MAVHVAHDEGDVGVERLLEVLDHDLKPLGVEGPVGQLRLKVRLALHTPVCGVGVVCDRSPGRAGERGGMICVYAVYDQVAVDVAVTAMLAMAVAVGLSAR